MHANSKPIPNLQWDEKLNGFISDFDYAQQRVRLQYRVRMPTFNPKWQVVGAMFMILYFLAFAFGGYGAYSFYGVGVAFFGAVALMVIAVAFGLLTYLFCFSRWWPLIYTKWTHVFIWVDVDVAKAYNMKLPYLMRFKLWVGGLTSGVTLWWQRKKELVKMAWNEQPSDAPEWRK